MCALVVVVIVIEVGICSQVREDIQLEVVVVVVISV